MKNILFLLISLISIYCSGQGNHLSPGNGNPLIPGYFADPTIKKFGDTWYIYATTDGNNDGRGPAEVWTSKDFVNWTMHEMNWPISAGGFYWAPDVTIGPDGKYRLLYNIPCESYIGIGETPLGPWKNDLGENKMLIPDKLVPGVITLDAQTFKDEDGKYYAVFGTWGIFPGGGCGIGLLNTDMKSFAKLAKIPNTEATAFFEAPFLFKRNGIYYFTYSSESCHNETYKVQYAISRTSPFGPYEFAENNPHSTRRGQEGNTSGWQFDRFLQIERSGNLFHARTSADGTKWKEMKGSPVSRDDLAGLPLQVGLFQCTYGEKSAWGKFSDFRLLQRKL